MELPQTIHNLCLGFSSQPRVLPLQKLRLGSRNCHTITVLYILASAEFFPSCATHKKFNLAYTCVCVIFAFKHFFFPLHLAMCIHHELAQILWDTWQDITPQK